MLKDSAGNRLFRKVAIRVVYPKNTVPSKTFYQHAGPHQGFNDGGIDEILMQTATRLDELYPWWDFELVPLAPEGRTAKYVFNCVGYRPMEGTDPAAAVAASAVPIPEFTQESQNAPTV